MNIHTTAKPLFQATEKSNQKLLQKDISMEEFMFQSMQSARNETQDTGDRVTTSQDHFFKIQFLQEAKDLKWKNEKTRYENKINELNEKLRVKTKMVEYLESKSKNPTYSASNYNLIVKIENLQRELEVKVLENSHLKYQNNQLLLDITDLEEDIITQIKESKIVIQT